MAKKRGFLGYNALLGDGSVMTSYTPTIGERMTDALRRMMFSDDRAGQQRAEKVMDVLSLTPVGMAADVYDAGREAGAGNYGTAGLMLGMAGIPGPSPKNGIRAFHGSPHSFDRFEMSKIGTGEGAQAYGHGLYFAENEGVARGYRDALTNKNTPQGKHIEKVAFNVVRNAPDRTDAELIPFVRNVYPDATDAEVSDALKVARANHQSGSMYEVNINADPEQFLDWDKPLSEQPESVRKAYAKAAAGDDPILSELLDGSTESLQLTGLFPRSSGAQAYNTFTHGNKEAATQRLRNAGIPGIKYLDAGSRGAGDGTRNYVVFDDRLIEIVRKYGIAGASAMLGYNLLEGMNPAQAEELKRIEGGR